VSLLVYPLVPLLRIYGYNSNSNLYESITTCVIDSIAQAHSICLSAFQVIDLENFGLDISFTENVVKQ